MRTVRFVNVMAVIRDQITFDLFLGQHGSDFQRHIGDRRHPHVYLQGFQAVDFAFVVEMVNLEKVDLRRRSVTFPKS